MDEQNAAVAPQGQPVEAQAIPQAQAVPSEPAKQEAPATVDFSPLGEEWKFQVNRDTATILPKLLQSEHITKELLETLTSDPVTAGLFFKSESGYRNAHNERFTREADAIKKAEARMKEISERERMLEEKEKEISDIEGDAYFYRDPKVREKEQYARKQVEDGRWTQEEAAEFVKPAIEQAKAEQKAKVDAREAKIKEVMETNAKIGRETFPEFDPELATLLVDGFVLGDHDPQESAKLFRKEVDRNYEIVAARAVAEYQKKLSQQPDTPGATQPERAIPTSKPSVENEYRDSVLRGRSIWQSLGLGGG